MDHWLNCSDPVGIGWLLVLGRTDGFPLGDKLRLDAGGFVSGNDLDRFELEENSELGYLPGVVVVFNFQQYRFGY